MFDEKLISKSLIEDENFEEIQQDTKLQEVLSRLNQNKGNKPNLILKSRHEEGNLNFKNLITENFERKNNSNSESARPLQKDLNDNEDEDPENEQKNKVALLDPEEEMKIEEHIKQFKVNSMQQYSIMRHYFLNWHEICQKRREMENNKKKAAFKQENQPLSPTKSNLSPSKQLINNEIKKDKILATPGKIKKDATPQAFEQKFMPSPPNKKKKKGQNNKILMKEGDVIHKISKADILRFIPFCNDIVLPKKK